MIYFDHSATTRLDKKVLKAMRPYLEEDFGNASSIHSFGQKAMMGVDCARNQVADFLGCEIEEVYFTSGATESNNLALVGLLRALKSKGIESPHIITTKIEHDAIIEPARLLEEEGCEVTFLDVDKKGVVNPEDIKNAIKENTVLVSVMYVNSEVGSVQPICEIGKIIKKINDSRLRSWQNTGEGKRPETIYFHTDATQAINFFDCNIPKLQVDMLSMSAHKIYGPKGVGALFIKNGVKIKSIQIGGHQEKNIRSGTLNVPGIVGLGEAISLISKKKREDSNEKIGALRDALVRGVLKEIDDVVLNTNRENSTPAHAHFSFVGAEGESVLMSLDMEGIAVSTGSACASGSLKSSHVLLAMGMMKEMTNYSVRFTLGKDNTEKDIEKLLKILPPIIEKFRKMNPIYKK